MAKTTANFGLIKPERSDNYSVDVMANNMDIIDAMIAPKTETDAVEERVTALEAGNFTNITTTGDVTVNGDLKVTGSLGRLTEESGVISAIKFSNSIELVKDSKKTYTYSSNPIANTVYFKFMYGTGSNNVSGSAYLKINGVTFYTFSKSGVASSYVYESTGSVELHDGDVIEASAGGSGVTMSITMISSGYLVKL